MDAMTVGNRHITTGGAVPRRLREGQMEQRMRRLEQRAERASRALEALAEEPEMARIALIGVLCSAAVCWFAIAWGDPRVLVLLPIVVAAAVGVARHKRGREGGHSDDVELEPAPAEVDEWLARLPTPPEPFAAARPQAVTAAEPVPWVASTPQAALDLPSRTVVYEVR